jgi:signal transduction histidine kinase
MLLRSRYIIVVNLVIVTTMTAFFLVSDVRLKKSHIDATLEGTVAGARARDIAETVAREITSLVHEREEIQTVREELGSMARNAALGENLLDMRLTLSLDDPKVIASVRGHSETLHRMTGRATLLEVSREEAVEVRAIVDSFEMIDEYGLGRSRKMVIRLVRYQDTWATRILIPYAWRVRPAVTGSLATTSQAVNEITDVGLIEILLDSGSVAVYWREYRLVQLFFILLMAITLTLFIDMTTGRMVLRPLERLTRIIRRAEEGSVDTSERFPSNEVGRVSATLTQMLATMQRLHGERVQALERLAGGVAHEIRNPLHSISMSAQYLKELADDAALSPAKKEDADEVLDMVLHEVKELDRITDQFMNLTRPADMAWEEGDLNELVERVLGECAMVFAEAGVEVRQHLSDDLPPVPMDVVRLRSAIYNLVQNAAQAMPNGGTLTVTTGSDGDEATVAIRDNGRGMAPATLDRIFDPYYTTRESEGGMGLGLTLTRNAVLAHDGDIRARSQPGAGAEFTVRLPLRADMGQRIHEPG